MNWENPNSIDCYFENIIDLGVDNRNRGQEDRTRFKVNFRIKESERYIADYDPIALELRDNYKMYKKKPDIVYFTDNQMKKYYRKHTVHWHY